MSISVSLAFKKYPDDKLVSFSNTIGQLMPANTRYLPLQSFVNDVNSKLADFNSAIAVSSQGASGATDDKNVVKDALIRILVRLARRLEEMAEDDGDNPRVITDAGFEIRNNSKTPKVTPIELDIPTLAAKNLDNRTGVAQINAQKVKNATNYAIRFKLKSEAVWQDPILNNKKEFIITGLQADMVYEFQIRAMGVEGLLSNWSKSVFIYVT